MRDIELKCFLFLMIVAAFGTVGRAKAQGPPKRLEISVDHSTAGANRTSAYYTPNDEVFLYTANGIPLYPIRPLKPGGLLVPVFYDVDGTMQLILTSGESFSWVLPDGSPYNQPVTFLSANPCGGAVSHTQQSSCNIAVKDGSYEYVCQDCNDPVIRVQSSTGNPQVSNTLLAIETLANVSLAAANGTRVKAESALRALKSARPPGSQEQLRQLLTQIADTSQRAEALAKDVDRDAKRGLALTPQGTETSSATMLFHTFPLKVGPQIDLLCADPIAGKATVTVAGWRGNLKELNLTWVNGRNLGDDWSIDHVVVNGDDSSCASKVFTADTVYAGTCVAQKQPTAVTFDLHVSGGDCRTEKAWHCSSSTSGGNCTQP
jgi:hypothetical protein